MHAFEKGCQPSGFYALGIRAPVLQAIATELLQEVQALRRTDVNVPLLLDFLEDPRLDQSTPVRCQGNRLQGLASKSVQIDGSAAASRSV